MSTCDVCFVCVALQRSCMSAWCRTQLQMQAMGFGKAKAREALQASHHSLDGAIEWLMANTT